MAASLVFDGIAFFYTLMFRGLQAHPMKIFMMISFANFNFMWPTLLQSFVCKWHLDSLYRYSSLDGMRGELNSLETLLMMVPF